MARISEMPKIAQLGLIVVVAVAVTAGAYFGFIKRIDDQNRIDEKKLQARRAEVTALRKYENDMPRLNQQIAMLRQQLEIQQRIVPDEKEADQFMHLLQYTAQSAGIEVRRWTAKPVVTREYYTEFPFDLELDGPYYSVLNFFDRVSKLERIINVSSLKLVSLNDGKKGYSYAPQESVTGACTATSFFTHDAPAPPVPAKGGKSKTPAPKSAAK